MTSERADAIAKVFTENYELAKKKGADEPRVALAAAIIYTIDDLLHCDEVVDDPGIRLDRKMRRLKEITDKETT